MFLPKFVVSRFVQVLRHTHTHTHAAFKPRTYSLDVKRRCSWRRTRGAGLGVAAGKRKVRIPSNAMNKSKQVISAHQVYYITYGDYTTSVLYHYITSAYTLIVIYIVV